MLYVFHGSDLPASVKKSHALIDSLRAKKPDAAYVNVEADRWSPAIIEEHLGGQGLFSSKYIIFLDRVTDNAEAKEEISGFIPAMNESENIFIVLEGKVNADLKKAFEKSAEKVVVSEEKAAGSAFKKKDFNIFALTDAIGSRDALKAWSIYRQAVDSGIEAENVAGTLFWQVKSMMLASDAGNAGEAGLNPFVFGKSKRYAANYSREELARLSREIITLYHDGHRGMVDLELAFERLVINCGRQDL